MIFIKKFFYEFLFYCLEISPYLLFGLILSGILNQYLKKEFVYKHLKESNLISIIKASFFGIPLPLCSCSVIPVSMMLRKQGASKVSVLSFLVSTPTTGVDSILATYALLGSVFAVIRPIAAFFNSFFVWFYNLFFKIENRKELQNIQSSQEKNSKKVCMHCKMKHEGFNKLKTNYNEKLSFRDKIRNIFHFALYENFSEIDKWLVLGIFIGTLITVLVPNDLLYNIKSNLFLSYLLVILVSLPLYICATGSIPIAASLFYKGFSPGSVLIFLILGPASNTTTLSFVWGKLGRKSFFIYFLSILTTAFLFAFLVDLFLLRFSIKFFKEFTNMNPFNVLNYITFFVLFISYLFINFNRFKKIFTKS